MLRLHVLWVWEFEFNPVRLPVRLLEGSHHKDFVGEALPLIDVLETTISGFA